MAELNRTELPIVRNTKEVFTQKLEFVKLRIHTLLNESENYVKRVRDYQKFEPLSIR